MGNDCVFNENDSVMFVGEALHDKFPDCYPKPGTIGKVKFVSIAHPPKCERLIQVQWPTGSTVGLDLEWLKENVIERVGKNG